MPPVYLAGGIYLAVLFVGFLMDVYLFVRFLTSSVDWNGMAERIRARPWLTKDALLLLLILMLIQVSAGMMHWAGIKLGWFAGDAKETTAALIQGVLFHGVALLIIWVFIRRRHSSWHEAFGLEFAGLKRAAGQGVMGYIGIIPIIVVTSILCQVFFYAAGYPVTLQDVVTIFLEPQSGWSLFFLLLLAVVVAPLVEEVLFRGILLPVLMKKMGAGTAVVASSLIFAGIHQHLPSFAPLFILAVVLSMLYIYSGSLWTPIVLHAVFNGVSICILLLMLP
ncbi:lysostaphin resistance A-like protein [Verrucomicrobiota bacterium]